MHACDASHALRLRLKAMPCLHCVQLAMGSLCCACMHPAHGIGPQATACIERSPLRTHSFFGALR